MEATKVSDMEFKARLADKGIRMTVDPEERTARLYFDVSFKAGEIDVDRILGRLEDSIPEGEIEAGDMAARGKVRVEIDVHRMGENFYILTVGMPKTFIGGPLEKDEKISNDVNTLLLLKGVVKGEIEKLHGK